MIKSWKGGESFQLHNTCVHINCKLLKSRSSSRTPTDRPRTKSFMRYKIFIIQQNSTRTRKEKKYIYKNKKIRSHPRRDIVKKKKKHFASKLFHRALISPKFSHDLLINSAVYWISKVGCEWKGKQKVWKVWKENRFRASCAI